MRFAQKVGGRSSPFSLQLVGLPALMIDTKLGCDPSSDLIATGTNFCYFRTFSARLDAIFAMLRLDSFDLLYSCRLVVDLLRIVELLRIGIRCTACRGVVVGIRFVRTCCGLVN